MKMPARKLLTTALLAAALVLGGHLLAETSAGPTHQESRPTGELDHRSGTLHRVDATDRTLQLKTFWNTRTYSLGEPCAVSMDDKARATIADLQPGQEIEIYYKDHDGVQVVTQIVQVNQEFTGHIVSLDPTNRVFEVKDGWKTRAFTALPECKVTLRDQSEKPFTILELGQRVTVTYLTPGDQRLAQSIAQRSLEFRGRVEVLDARTRTIRAGSLLANRTFRMGDDCQLVVDGRLDGDLSDLRISDLVTFHYEDVDGVLVANRIEREPGTGESGTAQLSSRQATRP